MVEILHWIYFCVLQQTNNAVNSYNVICMTMIIYTIPIIFGKIIENSIRKWARKQQINKSYNDLLLVYCQIAVSSTRTWI